MKIKNNKVLKYYPHDVICDFCGDSFTNTNKPVSEMKIIPNNGSIYDKMVIDVCDNCLDKILRGAKNEIKCFK